MYFAEAISNVAVRYYDFLSSFVSHISLFQRFIKHTFHSPHYPKPNFFVFNAGCQLYAHVKDCEWWQPIGLPVDVFHHKTKYKETDIDCQLHCNPANFPELQHFNKKTKKDEWYFNTSIAEQTNVWVVRLYLMCQEMRAVFYDFFLDQMVLMQNDITKKRLEKQGYNPAYFRAFWK
jgi:hypothetical protein